MKVLVQRSKASSVEVKDKIIGQISFGYVLFVCFETGDTLTHIDKAVYKITNLRIFEDPKTKKMNFNIKEKGGQILCISQFTLSWNGKKGHRPSFDASMEPKEAQRMYQIFCEELSKHVPVKTGVFAEDMVVNIINDGPVTFHFNF